MKRLMAMVLVLVLAVTMLTGCGGSNDDGMLKIGIIQLMEHPSLDTIRESIIGGLEEEGYVDGENIAIDYQNGQNDMSTMKNIAQKFVGDEVDVIVAIATPAAQAALSIGRCWEESPCGSFSIRFFARSGPSLFQWNPLHTWNRT